MVYNPGMSKRTRYLWPWFVFASLVLYALAPGPWLFLRYRSTHSRDIPWGPFRPIPEALSNAPAWMQDGYYAYTNWWLERAMGRPLETFDESGDLDGDVADR